MNRQTILKLLPVVLTLLTIATACNDDYLSDDDTRDNEYTVWYKVTYSTIYNFQNIAHVSYTNFFDRETYKYLGRPVRWERRLDGTHTYFSAHRVPKGATVELSTFVDVSEPLPDTKVHLEIEVNKGSTFETVKKISADAECPIKGNPFTISCETPK